MNFDSLPMRLVLRWELAVRAVLALLAPLIAGYLLGDIKAGLLAAIVAANVSIGYLGPDLGFFRWAVVAAVGSATASVLGVFISWMIWLEVPFLLALFTVLGAMMLGGLTSQLAFSPVAITGLLAVSLVGGPVTATTILAIVAGAAWSLVLVAVLPRWRGWPRIPVDRNTLAPNAAILRRLFRRPSWRDWAFPLLLPRCRRGDFGSDDRGCFPSLLGGNCTHRGSWAEPTGDADIQVQKPCPWDAGPGSRNIARAPMSGLPNIARATYRF
ncbi:MAG: hypothetical protein K0U64_11890 [Actinomycetia bacterium]|nr:hypothetical protein [Actinomycetes bacterium]